ncbi:MAG: sigma-54-dependent Fis family transcriptional regulator [Magnetococcales bacterium]|nr:sigma-54-dependent Fis family transcriptional regulator [Magnetococcales bacterium]
MTDQANTAQPAVVLVDDEASVLMTSKALLRTSGFDGIVTLEDSRDLLPFLENNAAAVIILDLMMPHLTGMQLLPEITRRFPDTPVIVMTASQELELAIQSMRDGALDYMIKPVEESRFIANVKRAMEMHAMKQQVRELKGALLTGSPRQEQAFSAILTRSPKMRAIFQYVEAVAPSKAPVLVMGETGVGKESLIQAIHDLSGRKGALVAVNVAGLDDHLFADALFGHTKGAFSGADRSRQGMIAKGAGGSLFLDEIGDLSPASQVKLLRLLQEESYYPLGSDLIQKSQTRIVCATNQDLALLVEQGTFRADLYYRLYTHQIILPPLRERTEDIPLLLAHFLKRSAQNLKKPIPTPPPELLKLLAVHPFPGNIRELKALVEDAVAQHTSRILSMESFEKAIFHRPLPSSPEPTQYDNLLENLPDPLPTLHTWSDCLIDETLKRSGGNQRIAASILGISRHTLMRRLRARSTDKES